MWKNWRNWENLDVSTSEDKWLATGREIHTYFGCENGKAIKIGHKSKGLKQTEIKEERWNVRSKEAGLGKCEQKGRTWKWRTENFKSLLKGKWVWLRESGHVEMKKKTVIRSALVAESEKWNEGRTNEKRENMCVFVRACTCIMSVYILQ
jgi:hypothetical protein